MMSFENPNVGAAQSDFEQIGMDPQQAAEMAEKYAKPYEPVQEEPKPKMTDNVGATESELLLLGLSPEEARKQAENLANPDRPL